MTANSIYWYTWCIASNSNSEATRCASSLPQALGLGTCTVPGKCMYKFGKGISRGRPGTDVRKPNLARPRGCRFFPRFSGTRLRYNSTPSLYTDLYALSPFCFFFSAAFAFLAEGLKTDTILCMPPRYRYVQIKTTAKLKKMYIHMMPAAVSQASFLNAAKITHTEVSPNILGEHVEAGCERIAGSVLTVPTAPVGLRLHVSA